MPAPPETSSDGILSPIRALRRAWGVIRPRRIALVASLGALAMTLVDCPAVPVGGARLPPPPQASEQPVETDQLVDLTGEGEATAAPARADRGGYAEALVAALCWLVILRFLLLIPESMLHAGWLRFQRAVLEGEPDPHQKLWSGRDRLWAMLGWKVLVAVGTVPVLIVALLPASLSTQIEGFPAWATGVLMVLGPGAALAYIGPGVVLTPYEITFGGKRPLPALRDAWRTAHGRRLPLLWFLFVLALVQAIAFALGTLLLCVGAVVLYPLARAVTETALTDAYLRLVRERR